MARYTFFVASDFYEAGYDEDGAFVAEAYYVVAEAASGARFAKGNFLGAELVELEEGCYFKDVRKEAEAEAEALLVASLDDDPATDDSWGSILAAYGSAAHSEADLIALEREDYEREAYA